MPFQFKEQPEGEPTSFRVVYKPAPQRTGEPKTFRVVREPYPWERQQDTSNEQPEQKEVAREQ